MRRDYYLFAVLVIILTGLIVVVNSQVAPGFSKVYFDNATVPDYIVPNVTYTITFIIESHERSTENYRYTVYLNDTVINDGNVSLAPNKVAQLSFTFSVQDATYRRVVLWERNTTYDLSGVWAILGEPLDNVTNVSVTSPGHRLPAYSGPTNLSFLLNTTRNVTLVRTITEKGDSGVKVTEYRLKITALGDEKYKVTVHESQFTYVPNSVVIRIVVETSSDRSYQILRRIPLGVR
ncbi:hypothetical protein DRN44_00135 [Thermococci archaeon]|nr:MAG: hypothetical protein DRN44_00135 [Thermococci archaeon]